MVIGMATKKVTVTLGVDEVDEIKRRVTEGSASSVSGFVQDAVERALDADAAWAQWLDEALERSGGALTEEEQVRADQVLGIEEPKQTVA